MSHETAFGDGLLAAQAGKRVLARIQFEQSDELSPNNPDTAMWLAWTADSPDHAVDILSSAVKAAPDNELLWAFKSVVEQLRDFEPNRDYSDFFVELIDAPSNAELESSEPVGDETAELPSEDPVAAHELVDEFVGADTTPDRIETDSFDVVAVEANGPASTETVDFSPEATLDETEETESPITATTEAEPAAPEATTTFEVETVAPAAEPETVVPEPVAAETAVPETVAPEPVALEAEDVETVEAELPNDEPAAADSQPEDSQVVAELDDAPALEQEQEHEELEASLPEAPAPIAEAPEPTPEESIDASDPEVAAAAVIEQVTEMQEDVDQALSATVEPQVESQDESDVGSQAEPEASQDEQPAEPPAAPAAESTGPTTVLVVDDSPTVLKLVSMTLSAGGYEVKTAANGIEAMKMLVNFTPALILLDVNMPRMDGYKLCKLIKRHEKMKYIPVVMLSGKDGMFDKLRGTLVGCNDYITKPFESADLLKQVEKYVSTATTN